MVAFHSNFLEIVGTYVIVKFIQICELVWTIVWTKLVATLRPSENVEGDIGGSAHTDTPLTIHELHKIYMNNYFSFI
jgi:hypothetical protein